MMTLAKLMNLLLLSITVYWVRSIPASGGRTLEKEVHRVTRIEKTKQSILNVGSILGILAILVAAVGPARAHDDDDRSAFRIAPIFSKPGGLCRVVSPWDEKGSPLKR